MKKTTTFLFVFLLIFSLGSRAQDAEKFFPKKNLMPVGAYYYPEHWDKDQWARDIKKIADLGFEFTHFGEFAWAMLEPEEGQFDFEWLDYCVEQAHQNGLKVIMCTPTPTPPAWLTTKYPEVLIVDENGIKQRHGTRLHINQMNETYRKYAGRIVRRLAEHYGNDPRIWGWQIDNEPHYQTLYDYSETAQQRFKMWLKDKYKTIDALNKAWGTPFWSQVYNNFDQIRIPNKKEGAGGSPHSILDFKRFTADEIANYLKYQANILEEEVSEDQWITTNYAYYKFLPPVDLFRARDSKMHFAAHTMYLLSTFLNYPKGDLAHRLGSGMELSFSNEMANSVNGYTGIMELQPGQINWGQWNSQPLPGAVRMWIWHSFGLGDRFVCTYRFRQPIYGGEHFHKGIVETDGITVAPGGKEYVQALNEIKSLRKYKLKNTKMPQKHQARQTAFLWKQDNLLNLETTPHNQKWDPWQHFYTYYENVKTFGSEVVFLSEDQRFDPKTYPFMLAPAYEMIDQQLVEKWRDYVEKGGNLILSCRSGMKDNNGHLWEALLQEPIWNLIGAKIEFFDQLPPGKKGTVRFDGKDYKWNVWADVIAPNKGTKVLATHQDQFFAGKPAAVTRKLGKGSVTYIGAWSESGELEKQIMRKVYTDAGAEILNLPNYVFTEWRDGFWVTVNYTSETVEAPIPDNAEILFGKRQVPPAGVAVWIEK